MTLKAMFEVYNEERAKLVKRMEEGGAIMDLAEKRNFEEFEATVQIFKGENAGTEITDRQIAKRIARDEVFYIQTSQVESRLKGIEELQARMGVPEERRIRPTAEDLLFGTPYGRYANEKFKNDLSKLNEDLRLSGVSSGKDRQKFISSTIFGSP
jgi:hypothetical protein